MDGEITPKKRSRGRPKLAISSQQFKFSVPGERVQRVTLYVLALEKTSVGNILRDALEEWLVRHGPQLDLLLEQREELRKRQVAASLLTPDTRAQKHAERDYKELDHALKQFSRQFKQQMKMRRERSLPSVAGTAGTEEK